MSGPSCSPRAEACRREVGPRAPPSRGNLRRWRLLTFVRTSTGLLNAATKPASASPTARSITIRAFTGETSPAMTACRTSGRSLNPAASSASAKNVRGGSPSISFASEAVFAIFSRGGASPYGHPQCPCKNRTRHRPNPRSISRLPTDNRRKISPNATSSAGCPRTIRNAISSSLNAASRTRSTPPECEHIRSMCAVCDGAVTCPAPRGGLPIVSLRSGRTRHGGPG